MIGTEWHWMFNFLKSMPTAVVILKRCFEKPGGSHRCKMNLWSGTLELKFSSSWALCTGKIKFLSFVSLQFFLTKIAGNSILDTFWSPSIKFRCFAPGFSPRVDPLLPPSLGGGLGPPRSFGGSTTEKKLSLVDRPGGKCKFQWTSGRNGWSFQLFQKKQAHPPLPQGSPLWGVKEKLS